MRLTPMQRDILWMVEEPGAEDLTTVANTILGRISETWPGEFLWRVQEAVLGLARLELISLCRDYGQSGLHRVPMTQDEARRLPPLTDLLRWDEQGALYRWDAERGGPYPVVLALTKQGGRAMRE